MSSDSGAASMKRSAPVPAARSSPVLMRPRAASRSSAVMRPLSTARANCFSMPAMPLATYSSAISIMVACNPAWTAAATMPAPICPAPATSTL